MKKSLFLFLVSFFSLPLWSMDAAMYQWKSHFAYGSMTQVVDAGNIVYGIAGGALFSVNKQTEEIQTYSKQSGLNGGDIARIGYDDLSQTLIIAYANGLIDFLKDGTFTAMLDLQQKTMSASKKTNKINIQDGIAYFCMPFGIMAVDVKNRLIKDTYYVGEEGSDVNILDIAFSNDSVYAISASTLYSVSQKANWMDYQNWQHVDSLCSSKALFSVSVWHDNLFIVADSICYYRKDSQWINKYPDKSFWGSSVSDDKLFLLGNNNSINYLLPDLTLQSVPSYYLPKDIVASGSTFWLATDWAGMVRQTSNGTQSFAVNGPSVNIPYRLKIANNKLYMLAGQRWADENPKRDANIMIYDINQDVWNNIPYTQVNEKCGYVIFDLMNVAVDPSDAEHFFVTTYGTGLLECQGMSVIRHYSADNSVLESAAPTSTYALNFVRIDGALFDAKGNLWLLNAGVENQVHVASPDQLAISQQTGLGNWYKMPINYVENPITISTPGEMFIDSRHSNWKWIPSVRSTPGLILLDDNNTPQNMNDDEAYYRRAFVDQDGNTVDVSVIYSIAQQTDGTIWIGLDKGLITIPSTVDYKTSNRCERIKIARNDGTGLADYLLETECIKAIAIDGANRKWFGSETSGLYLISSDGQETLAHFTEDNSPLLSNAISSLAVDPKTGRVFIGTDKGLMSYQSDAAMPFEDYSSVYAYPNPVRPDYSGVITISGLMDETVVHITDNAGNLVCETRSLGGSAIWDGCTADGRRVASGVYNVFCNESGGKHALVKILVMH